MSLAPLAARGPLVVTHGNGPQVGLLALQAAAYDDAEPYPLDVRRATPGELRARNFAGGSMGPKVEAAARFAEQTGRERKARHESHRGGNGVMSGFVSRAFTRRRQASPELAQRLPPGQYVEYGFPVLSYSPTPRIAPGEWTFRIEGMVGRERTWSMEELRALPVEEIPCDIHCVTKWSKLGTNFGGVSVDVLLDEAEPKGRYHLRGDPWKEERYWSD